MSSMGILSNLRFSVELNAAGVRARSGGGTLSVLAVASFAIIGWISMTVAGGAWMFYQRATLLPDYLSESAQTFAAELPWFMPRYQELSMLACAIIIPVVVMLAAATAVLGAAGRERRLAIVRLLGASRSHVIAIAVGETLTQAIAGLLVGTLLSLLCLPLWSRFSFQDTPIQLGEMILPWWGYLALLLIMLLIIAQSAARGLKRVAISPLGVARLVPPKRLSAVRILVTAVVLGLCALAMAMIEGPMEALGATVSVLVIFALFSAFNYGVPYLLQLFASGAARTGGPAWAVACRRIASNARKMWMRVAALGAVGLVAGLLAQMNFQLIASETTDVDFVMLRDIVTGGYLLIAAVFLVSATSTVLTQASAAYENRALNTSLHRMGANPSFMDRVALWETLAPMAVAVVSGLLMGVVLGTMMFVDDAKGFHPIRVLLDAPGLMGMVFAGCMLMLAAVVISGRLRRSVLRREAARRTQN